MAAHLGMTVDEVLAKHTSLQLREWMAYEVKAGPLGQRWDRDMIAELHYLMQWNLHLLGAKTPTKDNKNPAPEPHFPDRPWAPNPHEDEPEDAELDEIEREYDEEYSDVT